MNDKQTYLKRYHKEINKDVLFEFLRREHPQVIAIYFIMVDDYEMFGEFLEYAPKRLSTDISLRAASGCPIIVEDVMDILLKVMEKWLHLTAFKPMPDREKLYRNIKRYDYVMNGIEEIDPDLRQKSMM